MVKMMENPIKTDDLGGKPTIFGNEKPCFFGGDFCCPLLGGLRMVLVKIPDGKSKDMGMKSKVQRKWGVCNGVVLLELRLWIYDICMILQTVFYSLYIYYVFNI